MDDDFQAFVEEPPAPKVRSRRTSRQSDEAISRLAVAASQPRRSSLYECLDNDGALDFSMDTVASPTSFKAKPKRSMFEHHPPAFASSQSTMQGGMQGGMSPGPSSSEIPRIDIGPPSAPLSARGSLQRPALNARQLAAFRDDSEDETDCEALIARRLETASACGSVRPPLLGDDAAKQQQEDFERAAATGTTQRRRYTLCGHPVHLSYIRTYDLPRHIDWAAKPFTTTLGMYDDAEVAEHFRAFYFRTTTSACMGTFYTIGLLSVGNVPLLSPLYRVYWSMGGSVVCLLTAADIAVHLFADVTTRVAVVRMVFAFAIAVAVVFSASWTQHPSAARCTEARQISLAGRTTYNDAEQIEHCVGSLDPYTICTVVAGTLGTTLYPIPHAVLLGVHLLLSFVVGRLIADADTGSAAHEPASELAMKVVIALVTCGFTVAVSTLKLRLGHAAFETTVRVALQRKEAAQRAMELQQLLTTIVPVAVLPRLVEGGDDQFQLDRAPAASMLFADMQGFTAWASHRPASAVAAMLNTVVAAVDRLAWASPAVEKIKTIGDAYWAVAGIPERADDHADQLVVLGWDMNAAIAALSAQHAEWGEVLWRVAVHSGPLTGALFGQRQVSYEVFGETSRIVQIVESQGVPGGLCVTPAVMRSLLLTPGPEQVGQQWAITDRSTGEPIEIVELRPPAPEMEMHNTSKTPSASGIGNSSFDSRHMSGSLGTLSHGPSHVVSAPSLSGSHGPGHAVSITIPILGLPGSQGPSTLVTPRGQSVGQHSISQPLASSGTTPIPLPLATPGSTPRSRGPSGSPARPVEDLRHVARTWAHRSGKERAKDRRAKRDEAQRKRSTALVSLPVVDDPGEAELDEAFDEDAAQDLGQPRWWLLPWFRRPELEAGFKQQAEALTRPLVRASTTCVLLLHVLVCAALLLQDGGPCYTAAGLSIQAVALVTLAAAAVVAWDGRPRLLWSIGLVTSGSAAGIVGVGITSVAGCHLARDTLFYTFVSCLAVTTSVGVLSWPLVAACVAAVLIPTATMAALFAPLPLNGLAMSGIAQGFTALLAFTDENFLRRRFVEDELSRRGEQQLAALGEERSAVLQRLVPRHVVEDLIAWFGTGMDPQRPIARRYERVLVAFMTLRPPTAEALPKLHADVDADLALCAAAVGAESAARAERSPGHPDSDGVIHVQGAQCVAAVLQQFTALDKIKTVGDLVMVAGPFPLADTPEGEKAEPPSPSASLSEPALNVADDATLALSCKTLLALTAAVRRRCIVQVGAHIGSVVGTVQGSSRLAFDTFGDAVNIASRVMSGATAKGTSLQVTHAVRDLMQQQGVAVSFEDPRSIEAKGKGAMEVFPVAVDTLTSPADQAL